MCNRCHTNMQLPSRARNEAMIGRMAERRYRAGDSIEDICRACKLDRMHTVVVSDQDGRPIRVSCGYCGSEHNFRGGPSSARTSSPTDYGGQARVPSEPRVRTERADKDPFPLVSDRERTAPPMSLDSQDVELLLRRIIRE